MKTLQEVVKARRELQQELEAYEEARLEIVEKHGVRMSGMPHDVRNEYGHIASVCMKLRLQIDTLTYVINYDSELPNVMRKWGLVSSAKTF